MLRLRTILHPTDLSPLSDQAFELACSLAQDHGATLIVLHVIEQPITYGELGALPEPPEYRDDLRAEMRHRYHSDTVPLEYWLEDGAPVTLIRRVAEQTRCDLIVMATHGRHGLGRLFWGSVAEQVVRQAPCPVLTVKGPFPAPVPAGRGELART